MTAPRPVSVAVKLLAVGAMAVPLLGVDSCQEALNPVGPPPTADQVLAYDAAAQTKVRNAITIVEACYADTRNYVYCAPKQEVYDLGVIPNGVTSPGYSLTATSKSGTSFTATRVPGGGITRTCSAPGKGACGADGKW